MSADIGLIGLAVMGENLVLNLESRGFTVAVYNRTVEKVDSFVNGRGKGKKFIGCHDLGALCSSLKSPACVMMMVRAGDAVDQTIQQLLPHLKPGDIVIDGGNSHYADTNRRRTELEAKGFLFIGTGISGGEEGALNGPSIMPGGSPAAWPTVRPLFQAICAKVEDGSPCCQWVGEGGAGHFVKMVHNGIEYGDMQLIAEAYDLLRNVAGLNNEQIAATFQEWNKGDLDSYLIEITGHIFTKKDESGDGYVVDKILDSAGQKGTGKWTAINALDLGMPLTLIGEAVFARCLSALKPERVAASQVLQGPKPSPAPQGFIDQIRDALYCSKLVSYAQGFTLMREAGREYKWNLQYGDIALMWRGGCIIRSKFLGKIKEAFDSNAALPNLLLHPFFTEKVQTGQAGWRATVATAALSGIPTPAMSAALSYFDGYRSAHLPANLLQAQRDYFGAHTYKRLDRDPGQDFHTNWTGSGGSTASSTYTV